MYDPHPSKSHPVRACGCCFRKNNIRTFGDLSLLTRDCIASRYLPPVLPGIASALSMKEKRDKNTNSPRFSRNDLMVAMQSLDSFFCHPEQKSRDNKTIIKNCRNDPFSDDKLPVTCVPFGNKQSADIKGMKNITNPVK